MPEIPKAPAARIGAAPPPRSATGKRKFAPRAPQRSDYAFFKSIAPGTMKAMAEAEADDD